jgi:acetyl esterase
LTLDAQAETVRGLQASLNLPPLEDLPVDQAREAAMGIVAMQGEPEPVEEITQLEVPGPAGAIPVRVYLPANAEGRPLVVYFHGGGWVIGSIELLDRPCRALANITGCAVASVEYRLAPEHKFPAAVEDAYAATVWLAAHANDFGADSRRIVVAGDSAGGNLAAVTSIVARDQGGPQLALQVLHCPVTAAPTHGFSSYEEVGEGYMLTRSNMLWFWDHYTSGADDAANPLAAPLQSPDLSRLRRALIMVAGYDPLRDEGLAYAERLSQAGVPVELHRYDGQMHDFFWIMGAVDAAREAMGEIAKAIASLEG